MEIHKKTEIIISIDLSLNEEEAHALLTALDLIMVEVATGRVKMDKAEACSVGSLTELIADALFVAPTIADKQGENDEG